MLSLVSGRFRRRLQTSPSVLPTSVSQFGPPPSADGQLSPSSPGQFAVEPHVDMDDLPLYLSPAEETRSEHTYALHHKNSPWLVLKVVSSAGTGRSHPLFFDGATIDGSVELILASQQAVQSLSLELTGKTSTTGGEAHVFVSVKTMLWPTTNEKHAQTLPSGTRVWPFSIAIPKTVSVPYEGQDIIAPLPPTYSVKSFPAFLEYHLQVIVHRPPLRMDSHLTTSVVYLPRSRPRPSSDRRQRAYAELGEPDGPEDDPQGWHSVKGIIKGTFFSKLDAEVECTLHLAQPLCYSRGLSVPFSITFDSQATQAVDLFAQPASVKILLEQTVAVGPEALRSRMPHVSGTPGLHNTFQRIVGTGRNINLKELPSPERRRLEGEIPISRDLKPSFTFVRFALSYKVTLTVDAVGFVPADKLPHALVLSQEVAIATDPPRGPRQPMSVATDTDAVERAVNTNPDAVQALLLTGNQRFVHHHLPS